MQLVLLVIHMMIAAALVGVVLLQKSEGGALGIGGGGGGGFMTGRGTANLLTRTTAILAAAFFATSLSLTLIAQHGQPAGSVLDKVAPASAPSSSSSLPPLGDLKADDTKPADAAKPAAPATGAADKPANAPQAPLPR